MAITKLHGAVYILFISILGGCASSGDALLPHDIDEKGNPTWVTRGTNTIKTDNRRLFHGVGNASLQGNFSRQTSSADKQARDELGKLLTTYIEIVSRNYIASGKARSAGFTHQSATRQLEALHNLKLTSATVVGRWKDEQRRQIYSVAQVDLQKLEVAISRINANSGFRRFLTIEGGRIFDRMASREDL